MYDLGIVGCGAAGMACAIAAKKANPQMQIVIFEKKEILGKKIYATGNGRCNITNMNCENSNKVLNFFDSIGVMTEEEDEGRVYPISHSAKDVVFCMENFLESNNVNILLNAAVESIQCGRAGGFEINTKTKKYQMKKLVISTGGKAGPQYGSEGDGYKFAKELGHSVKKVYPCLTGIECKVNKKTKGARVKGEVSLMKSGTIIATEMGEIQFNEYGLSGICVMNLSRFLKLDEKTKFEDYSLVLDLMPRTSIEQTILELKKRKSIKGFSHGDLLRTLVNYKVIDSLLKQSNIGEKGFEISDEHINKLAKCIHQWELPVTGARGWKQAQCTGGGIFLDEINENTMESKLQRGLYLAGEVLDYDGPCGGYNLQFAWETGIKAGSAIGKETLNV